MIKCGKCKGSHQSVTEVRACYQQPTAPSADRDCPPPLDPSTEQYEELRRLVQERDVPKVYLDALKKYLESERPTQFGFARAIARLQGCPRKTEAPDRPADQDGMYRNPKNGEIFKIQYNRAQGDGRRLYAKRLVIVEQPIYKIEGVPASGVSQPARVRFDYVPGGMRFIRASWRMTIEEAKEFGALYGTCVRCGRTLTLEESIERAMGPVCAGKV